MADVHLSLRVDNEYLAYAAMKQALMAIRDMSDDWSKGKEDAVYEAELALDIEEELGNGA